MNMSVCNVVADAAIIAGVCVAIFGVVYYIVQRKQQNERISMLENAIKEIKRYLDETKR